MNHFRTPAEVRADIERNRLADRDECQCGCERGSHFERVGGCVRCRRCFAFEMNGGVINPPIGA